MRQHNPLRLIASAGLLLVFTLSPANELRSFSDPALGARYAALIAELRCLVCQNQSLADSNADLAKDMRDQVYAMLTDGKSDSEITDHMVERFGDFVLYRPPLRPATLLLWFGPPLMALLGLAILLRHVKRRATAPVSTLSEAEELELQKVLAGRESSRDASKS